MKINERLKKIGDLVPLSSCPLDIGCDHALLSIYLVKEKKIKKCYASDNKEGPFKIAQNNLDHFHLNSSITLILQDGLNALREDVDTITISGMGGLSINKIMNSKKEKLEKVKTIILSPNNFVPSVRLNMMKLGYKITEEFIVLENKVLYPILVFQKAKVTYRQKDIYLGPILKTKHDPLTKEYYQRELEGRENLLKLLPKNYFSKIRKTKREIKWLKKLFLD